MSGSYENAEFRFMQSIQCVESKTLDGYFRKNLFFCIKETINNALKHSGASEISVTIGSPDRKGLQIVVSDNGSGTSQTNPFGNGLRNVQKRISSLRGTVKYQERVRFDRHFFGAFSCPIIPISEL